MQHKKIKTSGVMPRYASLQLVILLTISIPVQCQFEFNDLQAVRDIIIESIVLRYVSCVAILRPNDESPQQKSAIDRLTEDIIKAFRLTRSVMSYTTEMYAKYYMDRSMRTKDACIFWMTVVMVNNSTTEQLAYLSQSQFFEHPYWMIFANRSKFVTLVHNVNIPFPSRVWVVQPNENGLYLLHAVGRFGADLGLLAWTRAKGFYPVRLRNRNLPKETVIRVGTVEFPPYMKVNRSKHGQITSVSGFHGDLWNHLQETLQFNSVYLEPKDGIIGSYNENGNWTGLYSMAVKQEIDVLLYHMTVSRSRDHVVDFLHPIERTKYKIFYKKDAVLFDWLKVFRPLDYFVWIALVVWIIVGGIASYLITTAEKNLQHPRKHFSLISCIYFVLRALCNQGSEQVPKLWAQRIFLLTSYFLAAVIVPSYSASLISVLTVKTPVEPFQELNDILATDFKLSMESNSTDYDFFEKTTDPIHRKIYETSVIKTKAFRNYRDAMENACKKRKTVFFGTLNELTATYLYKKVSCVLLPLNSEISPVYKTISVAKHSQYRHILKTHLFRMIERGLVNHYSRFYFPSYTELSRDDDIGIGLVDVGAVFVYLGILLMLSLGIFCLELLSWKYHLQIQDTMENIKKRD